jgi:hypothetical protein
MYGAEEKFIPGFWWGNLKEEGHLTDLRINGRMILKRTLKTEDGIEVGWHGVERIHVGRGKVVGFCGHGNELSDSVTSGEFRD